SRLQPAFCRKPAEAVCRRKPGVVQETKTTTSMRAQPTTPTIVGRKLFGANRIMDCIALAANTHTHTPAVTQRHPSLNRAENRLKAVLQLLRPNGFTAKPIADGIPRA